MPYCKIFRLCHPASKKRRFSLLHNLYVWWFDCRPTDCCRIKRKQNVEDFHDSQDLFIVFDYCLGYFLLKGGIRKNCIDHFLCGKQLIGHLFFSSSHPLYRKLYTYMDFDAAPWSGGWEKPEMNLECFNSLIYMKSILLVNPVRWNFNWSSAKPLAFFM